jgi:hypothetical protein
MQGWLLRADDRIVWRFINIDLSPVRILFRNVVVREDCFNRALWYTCIAIDASISIDIKTIGKFVKSLDRTDCGAVGVFAINAWLNNYVGHWLDGLLSVIGK